MSDAIASEWSDRDLEALRQRLNDQELSGTRQELISSMIATIGRLASEETGMLDLKIAESALDELANAFDVFRPYREIPKLTMFGSARTSPHDPVYTLAHDLAADIAAEGWMVITGAGPGIMQAGLEGAGR
ncbi:MAG: cytochrome D ubiquinol oxidase subunit II, partial [Actinobacteria bacterium]|nr:cytochrome D ubiquinol oxidase subunit II [Actinomycetota bacterium]